MPDVGSAFAADIDNGVETRCRGGVENPPSWPEDLRFVPSLARAAEGCEVDAAGWTLRAFVLRTERETGGTSLTGVRRGWEDGAGKKGEGAVDEERNILPSSPSSASMDGCGCLQVRCGYRVCTGRGDLKGD